MKIAYAALAILPATMLLHACASTENSQPQPAQAGAIVIAAPEEGSKPALVAPIFEHGKGRYKKAHIFFIPENEALAVIADELSKAGIDTSLQNAEFNHVQIKARIEIWNGDAKKSSIKVCDDGSPLVADFYDAKRKIAVSFYRQGFVKSCRSFWIPGDCDTKEAAKYLSDSVAAQGKGFIFAAFYDPLAELDNSKGPPSPDKSGMDAESWEKARDKWRGKYEAWLETEKPKLIELSKEQLRAQVKDFVEWLKTHGQQ